MNMFKLNKSDLNELISVLIRYFAIRDSSTVLT